MKKFTVKFLSTELNLESDHPEKVKDFAQSISDQVLEIKAKKPGLGDLKALFLSALLIRQELEGMKSIIKELELIKSNRDVIEEIFMSDLNFINDEVEKCIKNLKG
ncbi:hypothetical protein Cyrtocomes_00434 [Candidatus Cyrtobacter comes]|uniref:Cell division protein ZapA n=1 Tax=Candidatus Cyrtobacter comes TaxID=675776 RepID=A0ABU5L7P8_9RICK|nr:hypothetical protein [Candidatus Cyrtobacter comes]MDZ5762067.1 hypothetical protein [Candidatus Cyrtobacter comes]